MGVYLYLYVCMMYVCLSVRPSVRLPTGLSLGNDDDDDDGASFWPFLAFCISCLFAFVLFCILKLGGARQENCLCQNQKL